MIKNFNLERLIKQLKSFFLGPVYPFVVGGMVLVSHVFKIEYYLNFVNIALCILALLVCESLRPLIVVLCTYVFQVSVHSMSISPDSPSYYFGGVKLVTMVILFVLVAAALVFFFYKNKLITKAYMRTLPMKSAALLLSSAFLLNGVFSSSWVVSDLFFGLIQVLCFFVIFYIFLLGLRKEKREELASYFAYVSAVIALVLIGEVIYLYLSNDALIVDGSVVKEQIQFGWGIWNTAGQQLVMTIPMLFYGVMKNKYPWFYFAVAAMTVFAAVMTLSRNALIFSVLAYGACSIIACFFGKRQRPFRIIIPIGIAVLVIGGIVFKDKIFEILADYVSRGLSDNGRFELWGQGIDAFFSAPIFGKGFYGVYPGHPPAEGFFVWMAHNTVVELMGAMGAIGFAAYAYYRFETVKQFIKQPSLSKTMLGISLLTVLLGSLLDNFIFYSLPMLYYSVALAIAFIRADNAEESNDCE